MPIDSTAARAYLVSALGLVYVLAWPLFGWLQCWQSKCALLAVYYSAVYVLAWTLHQHHLLTPAVKLEFAPLWTLFAHQGIKFLCAAVDPDRFNLRHGLSPSKQGLHNIPWVPYFLMGVLPPVLVFGQPSGQVAHSKHNTIPGHFVARGLIQIAAMVVLALFIFHDPWNLQPHMPSWMDSILSFYILALSYGTFDIFCNAPAAWLVTNGFATSMIPCTNVPVLATAPSDFWRRWSASAGYELRAAIYTKPTWQAAARTFAANATLHILWCGPQMTGRFIEWRFTVILWVGPMVALTLERTMPWLPRWIVLYATMVGLVPFLLAATGFPARSWDVSAMILRYDND